MSEHSLHFRPLATLPQVALFATCFLAPLVVLIGTALSDMESYRLVSGTSLANFATVLSSSTFWSGFYGSSWLAAAAALLTGATALPLSLYIKLRASRRMQLVLLSALVLPLLTNYVVRAYSLKIVLANQGLANYFLSYFGVEPLKLLYSPSAVLIAYTFYFTAVAVLAQLAGIGRLSREIVHTASDLGARPLKCFLLVVLPLASRGITLQLAVVFAFAFSDTIVPQTIGGNAVFTLSSLLTDHFRVNDWPRAAVVALAMTSVSVPVIALCLVLGMRISKEHQWVSGR